MGGGKGRLISQLDRLRAIELINEANSNGASRAKACHELQISVRTLQRWEMECKEITHKDADADVTENTSANDNDNCPNKKVGAKTNPEAKTADKVAEKIEAVAVIVPESLIKSAAQPPLKKSTFDKRQTRTQTPKNKLSNADITKIFEVINSEPYRDLPPCKIVPKLADVGLYLASESTIYRLLRSTNQLSHRSMVKPNKHSRPKELVAYQPNQLWSWDISYLPSLVFGVYFYLYMIVDIYSRKIVGWSVHDVESGSHASSLIRQAYLDENIKPGQLSLHSDNGAPMRGATMFVTLEHLGVARSFSRPSVSDDNAYSEALFKTVKYNHPDFMKLSRFADISEARAWCESFVNWYNAVHLHSGLKFITPNDRHTGADHQIMCNRANVYEAAKQQHPERWTSNTRNWSLPEMVSLNPNSKTNVKRQKKYRDNSSTMFADAVAA